MKKKATGNRQQATGDGNGKTGALCPLRSPSRSLRRLLPVACCLLPFLLASCAYNGWRPGYQRWVVTENIPSVKEPGSREITCRNERGEKEILVIDARSARIYPKGFVFWTPQAEPMLPELNEKRKGL